MCIYIYIYIHIYVYPYTKLVMVAPGKLWLIYGFQMYYATYRKSIGPGQEHARVNRLLSEQMYQAKIIKISTALVVPLSIESPCGSRKPHKPQTSFR